MANWYVLARSVPKSVAGRASSLPAPTRISPWNEFQFPDGARAGLWLGRDPLGYCTCPEFARHVRLHRKGMVVPCPHLVALKRAVGAGDPPRLGEK